MNSCPSGFKLTQYNAADLSDSEMSQIEEHLASCAPCRAALEEIESEIAPFLPGAAEHRRQLIEAYEAGHVSRRSSVSGRRWLVAASSLAAAAAVIIVLIFNEGDYLNHRDDSETAVFRSAVTVGLEVVAKRDEQQFRVLSGSSLREDDALKFWVTAEKRGFVSIFSIDGTGVISEFYPATSAEKDASAFLLEAAGRQRFPGSVVLDNTVGDEWLILLYSRRPFDRDEMHEKMRQLMGDHPQDAGRVGDCQYRFIRIRKKAN